MNKPLNIELSYLLKKKGFDEKCDNGWYLPHPEIAIKNGVEPNTWIKLPINPLLNQIKAPTISEVISWLYEKHNIYIHISPHGDDETLFKDCEWWFSIYRNKLYNLCAGSKVTPGIEGFKSIEQAYTAAIEYILNNLI